MSTRRGFRAWFVRRVYSRHNDSARVRQALTEALAQLDGGGWGADLGCGGNSLHPRLLRVELYPEQPVDCRADIQRLPFRDNSLKVVVSQEVFEHLPDPWAALQEVERVLEPGGMLYLQTPFVIGRHAGPNDYWRFTAQGLRELVERSGLAVERLDRSVGAGTGAYRIAVELVAGLCGAASRKLYIPAKAAAAALFAPLRWLDWIEPPESESDRIAGGFLAMARKPL